MDDAEKVDDCVFTVHPAHPDCTDVGGHQWTGEGEGGSDENPGVFGSGGGVIIHEHCKLCGIRRITDTWANGPGGEQGYETVRYESGADIPS